MVSNYGEYTCRSYNIFLYRNGIRLLEAMKLSEVEICGLKIEQGTKTGGNLLVGPYFYHNRAHIRRWLPIPFSVIRGTEDGPTLCIIAGVHPTEYAGIDAAIRLVREIKPKDLKGMLVVVPVVNIPGFWERNYINPIDGKNLANLYPGIDRASRGEAGQSTEISDLMMYAVFHEIIMKGDYFLTFHGGDIAETEVWSVVVPNIGNEEIEKKSMAMAKASGITYIAIRPGPSPQGLLTEAPRRGKPGIVVELCQGNRLLPEESQAIFDATLNIMAHLKMIDREPTAIKEQPGTIEGQKHTMYKRKKTVHFTKRGIYYTSIKPGDRVTEGQKVGELRNLNGEIIETIYAPATGIITMAMINPVKLEGDVAITVKIIFEGEI